MPVLLTLPSVAALAIITAVLLMTYAWEATITPLIQTIVAVLDKIRIPTFFFGSVRLFGVLIDTLNGINSLVHWVAGKAGQANTVLWNQFVHHLALAWQAIGESIDLLSRETLLAFDYLKRHAIPALIHAALGPIASAVYWQRKRIEALIAQVAKIPHIIERVVVHDVPAAVARAPAIPRIIFQTIPAAATKAIAIPNTLVQGLQREVTALEKWVKAHARDFAPATAVGLISAVLFRKLGLGWLRCAGVNRVGRGLCGFSGLIETLASGAIAAFLVTDLCRFASALEYAAVKIRPLMLDFVAVEQAVLTQGCKGRYSHPPALKLAPRSPTPVIDAIAL